MNMPSRFLKYRRLGQQDGFPECCVMQFARELMCGIMPFATRKILFRTFNGEAYVPCDECVRKEREKKMGLHLSNISAEITQVKL